jgi:outer membrane biosynthesis protein TonB
MNLRARIYVENQKKNGQAKFETRLGFLREKGLDSESIQRDATLRRIKALIRKANFRLARIAAEENLNQERTQAKAERLAAEKAAREKSKKEEEEVAAGKKGKKEKKERKEKPAKQEKQEKPQQKKGKEEKKGAKVEKEGDQ